MSRSANCTPKEHWPAHHSLCRTSGCTCPCHDDSLCPITMPEAEQGSTRRGKAARCSQPLAPNAKFCAKHEADRIRLSR